MQLFTSSWLDLSNAKEYKFLSLFLFFVPFFISSRSKD